MHTLTEPSIIIGFGLYEAVEGVLDNPSPHNNYTDTAHTTAFTIGGLKIYSCKVLHVMIFFTYQLCGHRKTACACIGHNGGLAIRCRDGRQPHLLSEGRR